MNIHTTFLLLLTFIFSCSVFGGGSESGGGIGVGLSEVPDIGELEFHIDEFEDQQIYYSFSPKFDKKEFSRWWFGPNQTSQPSDSVRLEIVKEIIGEESIAGSGVLPHISELEFETEYVEDKDVFQALPPTQERRTISDLLFGHIESTDPSDSVRLDLEQELGGGINSRIINENLFRMSSSGAAKSTSIYPAMIKLISTLREDTIENESYHSSDAPSARSNEASGSVGSFAEYYEKWIGPESQSSQKALDSDPKSWKMVHYNQQLPMSDPMSATFNPVAIDSESVSIDITRNGRTLRVKASTKFFTPAELNSIYRSLQTEENKGTDELSL